MKLNQVTVGTTDFEASAAFYEALGLKRIVSSPPRYARFETPGGETFSIEAVEAVGSTTIVYFEVEDVDAFVEGHSVDAMERLAAETLRGRLRLAERYRGGHHHHPALHQSLALVADERAPAREVADVVGDGEAQVGAV